MPAIAMLGVLLVAPVPPQDPKPEAQAKDAVEAVAKELSDSEARAVVAEFKKASRDKDARLAQRLEAVAALGRDRHALLVKPLAQTVQREAALTVRKKAAELLGHQPPKAARRVLVGLIEEEDQAPEVAAALIDSLSSAGYESDDWDEVEPWFEREFGEKHTAVQQAILRLVIAHREKRAWRLLLRHVDEPLPKEVQPLENPPAEYWEARWKAWRIWRADAREALFTVTGQRFSSSEEARIWIAKNGSKVGLK